MADSPTPWWKRRSTRWAVSALVIGAVAFFFARSLINNAEEVRRQDIGFDGWWLVATALFAVAVPLTGLLWGQMVRNVQPDARISAPEAIAVQCASWLLKYIPGQVGSLLNKVLWAGKKGISRTAVIITFVYEQLYLQLASIVPAAVILVMSLGFQIFGANPALLLLPVLALIPLGLVLYPPFFRAIVNIPARRALKGDVPRGYFLSGASTVWFLIGFLGPRILNGVGFLFIAASVTDLEADQWLPFAAAYILAGAIGILAVFVPSGLGVREAVIVAILSQYISVPEAIIISLLARLCSTVGDVLVAFIYAVTRLTVAKEFRP